MKSIKRRSKKLTSSNKRMQNLQSRINSFKKIKTASMLNFKKPKKESRNTFEI